MELLPLRYFQVVARHEHISRAAEELRVAQPSVSRTIARLEEELGVRLFDRQGRGIALNRFGAAFLARVDRALAELDEGRRELADAAGLERGAVSVAAETALTLRNLLLEFRSAHPEADVRLYQSTAGRMVDQLRRREVDFCLASQPLTGLPLESVELLDEEVLLVVPLDHPLAGRSRVAVAELAGEPFVTTRPGHWQRALADRLFAAAGVEPVIVCEGDEPAATADLISAGLGIGLVPAMARQLADRTPFAWLHVDAPDCRRRLSLVWRTDAYLSRAAQRFRDLAVRHFRDQPW
ncbi:LysR substrate-binding domain-containing protein [Saccharothrix sp.]|uniref:LysR substrate-binding domain-containing protein n=1 Tax=Saccharothrix sp. TaxID=1873460 RepID=UPI0028115944|nr:LysR substrate-binding domain-containing protein [Saccharothrix sp.]